MYLKIPHYAMKSHDVRTFSYFDIDFNKHLK